MALSHSLLPEYDHEMAVTRRVLEQVPLAEAGWRPHPRAMSVGQLATHLADIPSWTRAILERDMYDMAAGRPGPPEITHRDAAGLLASFDRRVASARASIEQTGDAQLAEEWRLASGPDVVARMTKLAALRRYVLGHLVHHRGQMSVYLRLLGVAVPAICGPSADERA